MRSIRSRDTKPELIVRRVATALGYRYRLYKSTLPGKPDLVFASRRKVIFVHGCFWHGHDCKRGAREPKSNIDYWRTKVRRNRERDTRALTALSEADWSVLVIWECETHDSSILSDRIAEFLN